MMTHVFICQRVVINTALLNHVVVYLLNELVMFNDCGNSVPHLIDLMVDELAYLLECKMKFFP